MVMGSPEIFGCSHKVSKVFTIVIRVTESAYSKNVWGTHVLYHRFLATDFPIVMWFNLLRHTHVVAGEILQHFIDTHFLACSAATCMYNLVQLYF